MFLSKYTFALIYVYIESLLFKNIYLSFDQPDIQYIYYVEKLHSFHIHKHVRTYISTHPHIYIYIYIYMPTRLIVCHHRCSFMSHICHKTRCLLIFSNRSSTQKYHFQSYKLQQRHSVTGFSYLMIDLKWVPSIKLGSDPVHALFITELPFCRRLNNVGHKPYSGISPRNQPQ